MPSFPPITVQKVNIRIHSTAELKYSWQTYFLAVVVVVVVVGGGGGGCGGSGGSSVSVSSGVSD